MADAVQTIYDIIDGYRDRPAMYAGNLGRDRPFTHLHTFVCGLQHGHLDAGVPNFWSFSRWITARIEGCSVSLPWDWLLDERGEEQSYADYFRYLAEFRECRISRIYLVDVSFTDLKPSFHYLREGNRVEPEAPRRLAIEQYSPSPVYYLLEEYAHRVHYEFPFFNSAHDVMAEAKRRWGLPVETWQAA